MSEGRCLPASRNSQLSTSQAGAPTAATRRAHREWIATHQIDGKEIQCDDAASVLEQVATPRPSPQVATAAPQQQQQQQFGIQSSSSSQVATAAPQQQQQFGIQSSSSSQVQQSSSSSSSSGVADLTHSLADLQLAADCSGSPYHFEASHSSSEAGGDGGVAVERGPSSTGNAFDVRMAEEADGIKAAHKVVDCIKSRGVCLIQANAPQELLHAACKEAQQLWDDGVFGPPLQVQDKRSMLEPRLWQHALADEAKVLWIRDPESRPIRTNALRVFAGNLKDFAFGLAPVLEKEVGLKFDRVGQAMLSCYSGDRTYTLHVDNPHHGDTEDGDTAGNPDNSMRLSFVYYINTHWEPNEIAGLCSEGGLDICLTDPSAPPPGATAARRAPRLRIAPHADSLAIFLSERIAHEIVATKGDENWFCLTMWAFCEAAPSSTPQDCLWQHKCELCGKEVALPVDLYALGMSFQCAFSGAPCATSSTRAVEPWIFSMLTQADGPSAAAAEEEDSKKGKAGNKEEVKSEEEEEGDGEEGDNDEAQEAQGEGAEEEELQEEDEEMGEDGLEEAGVDEEGGARDANAEAEAKDEEASDAAPDAMPPQTAGSNVAFSVGTQLAQLPDAALNSVLGDYIESGANHGRPSFQRTVQAGVADVFLFYWDERDGEANSGWWFGDEVGSFQVLARAAVDTERPPQDHWLVPWNAEQPTAGALILNDAFVEEEHGAWEASARRSRSPSPVSGSTEARSSLEESPLKKTRLHLGGD